MTATTKIKITSDMVRHQTEQLQELTGQRYYLCRQDYDPEQKRYVITEEFDSHYRIVRDNLTLAEAYHSLCVANDILKHAVSRVKNKEIES